MTANNTISPYRDPDWSVALYQVPSLVVNGEKLLYHALYGNEAYEQLRKFFLATEQRTIQVFFNYFYINHSFSKFFDK
jgi:hypothetical protein